MNILSLFDGMSCGRVALDRAGIKVDKYFASEVDKYAIQIVQKNYPDTIQLGSITGITYEDGALFHHQDDNPLVNGGSYTTDIDMIIGGSPCQDLSIAKKDGKGLAGEKSGLFFEYVRLLKEIKPKYFLLENVASMKKADKEEITRILTEIYPDTQCCLINSSLVSAQNRKRLYWTNIQGVIELEDKQIYLKDILEDIPFDDPRWKPLDEKYVKSLSESNECLFEKNNVGKLRQGYEYFTPEAKVGSLMVAHGNNRRVIVRIPEATKLGYIEPVSGDCVDMAQPKSTTRRGRLMRYKSNAITTGNQFYLIREKSFGVTATYAGACPRDDFDKSNRTVVVGENQNEYIWRKLTTIECERLQTLPDNYTEGVSNAQRYKMIGNGWTVNIIAHIFSFLGNVNVEKL